MNALHCMIDLETLGLQEDAHIVSIGACIFDANGIHNTYYAVVSHDSQPERSIDPGTVAWWMGQGDEARAVFNHSGVKLEAAVRDFFDWCFQHDVGFYWGNDPQFDLGKLENAAQHIGTLVPWPWYAKRDFRTIRMVLDTNSPREGTYHNAKDDAVYQAKETIRALGDKL